MIVKVKMDVNVKISKEQYDSFKDDGCGMMYEIMDEIPVDEIVIEKLADSEPFSIDISNSVHVDDDED